MENSTQTITLTVSDVKQYVYCPRVVYFSYFLPVRRPTTYKMEEGKLEHEHIAELEQRRSLKAYGLFDGERQFNVNLYSKRLELTGKLDMVITTASEVIPVDFKNTGGTAGLNHKYQLTAYALLVEDQWQRPVRRGFIYLVPQKKAQEITITPGMRLFVKESLARIRDMMEREAMPHTTRHRARCIDCEFRNFCNDVA